MGNGTEAIEELEDMTGDPYGWADKECVRMEEEDPVYEYLRK